MASLSGSIVAIVTPMHEDGSLDLDAFRKLMDWHIAEGTDGIVVVGTTGESPTLDYDEHIDVIRRTVEFAAGRVPVMAGTGSNATTEALDLTKRADEAGADEFHEAALHLGPSLYLTSCPRAPAQCS